MQIPGQGRVSWVLVVLAVMAWTGEARVKLNSIRTVILRESHVQAFNRSIGDRGDDMVYPCISDLECSEGSYCHAPSRRNPAPPRCLTCRRKKRRCHRDGMCCSGNHCSNNACVPVVVSHSIQDLGWRRGGRKTGKSPTKPSTKGGPGSPCVRSADCSLGHCCARHFWSRVCKPLVLLGQVCTRQRRKLHHSLELFQRCDCGAGLSCRPLARHAQQLTGHAQQLTGHAHQLTGHAHRSSASSSSSSSLPSPTKARLHVCQRE
ncbi:dickkopf-related protein 2-like [Osmerus eperlanus]|uniref:dickkopf-related protein 2-like n=1 Tax=Osmerus eperlanus TaxID=29151 RepID=UPI002E152CA4